MNSSASFFGTWASKDGMLTLELDGLAPATFAIQGDKLITHTAPASMSLEDVVLTQRFKWQPF